MSDGPQQPTNDVATGAGESPSADGPGDGPTRLTNGDDPFRELLPPSGPWDPFRLAVIDRDRYRVAEQVAQGGGGKILRARDRRLDRPVALKEALSDGNAAEERFVCEALLTARLQHPSIIPVYEAGRWPSGEPFFAMKFVSGRSFAGVVDDAETIEARLALLPHVLAVAEAMAYAHSERIIHRDLKPANILVGDFGETVVIDWGLAKDLSPDPFEHSISLMPGSHPPHPSASGENGLTLTGTILGTPAFMPPEQAEGQPVDERADVYALGAILYHVLAGKPPYDSGNSVEDLARVLAGPPVALERLQPAVPEELHAIVRKAMARDPRDRYPTARELSDDLRRFQTGQIVGAHRYSSMQLLARFVRRNRTVVASVLAALVVLVVLGTVSLRRILEARDTAAARQREAEAAHQQMTRLADGLIVVQARTSLDQDPNRALAWLKRLSPAFDDWSAARVIAADAESRGISTELRGHTKTINALGFSPDGRLIATGSDDRTVRLWDVETGEHRVFAGHSDEVWRLAFSPDGSTIASGGLDPAIRLWDVKTGSSRVLQSQAGAFLYLNFSQDGRTVFSTGYSGLSQTWHVATGKGSVVVPTETRLARVVFSPDGKYVAGRDAHRKLWLLNVEKGKREPIEMGPLVTNRLAVAFSSNSRWMATIQADSSVGVWDFAMRKGQTFKGHTEPVTAVAFSPDSTWLASAAPDRTVRLWNLSSGQARVFEGHIRPIEALAFSRDGRQLASGSRDHTVRLWDLESGSPHVLLGFDDGVTVLQFSPDGRTLAAGSLDNSLRLFHLESKTSRILEGHTAGVFLQAFSPNGELLATAGQDGTVRLWSVSGGGHAVLTGHEGSILDIAFSPDGRLLATAGADGTLRTWDRSGRADKILRGHHEAVASIAVSPDQKLLASGGHDGTVRLWQIASGEGQILFTHERPVPKVMFTPGGRWIVSGDDDGTLRLGNVDSGESRVLGHHQSLLTFDISPTGTRLASVGDDRVLRLWDVASAAGILAVPIGGVSCRRILFTPDGSRIVVFSGDHAVQILDAETGDVRAVLRGHEGRVDRGALSPDGRTLATASQDHTVRIWDLYTGESRALRGHTDIVRDVGFSADGKLVASVSADKTVRLWSDDLPKDPAALRAWLNAATPETVELRAPAPAP